MNWPIQATTNKARHRIHSGHGKSPATHGSEHRGREQHHAERQGPRHRDVVQHGSDQQNCAPVQQRRDCAQLLRHGQIPEQTDQADDDDRHADPVQHLVRRVAVAVAVFREPLIDRSHGPPYAMARAPHAARQARTRARLAMQHSAGRSRRTRSLCRARFRMSSPARRSVAAELDPLDLYNVRSMLSDEERLVQDSVGKFVDDKVDSDHRRVLRGRALPARADPGGRGARTARQLDSRLRLRGPERSVVRADLPGAGARRLRPAQLRVRAVEPVHVSDLRVRQRRAEADVAAAHGARRSDRLLRPHRAARRLGSREHEDASRAARARTGC